ncbi:MAG: hypothetical protein ACOVNU_07675 [Candidatus Kapaibacteriota bacterium]|jgi:hypothetical protein
MKNKINHIFRPLLLSLAMMLVATSIYATTILLNYFNARTDGKAVTIEWKANLEDGLKFYELERSEDNNYFKKVFIQKPRGASFSYRFVDEDALKEGSEVNVKENKLQNSVSYSYRLKMTFEDGDTKYSDLTYVSNNVNSVRRTWGMLKEMFR